MLIYPFALFFHLLIDGFNPYDNLTAAQMREESGFIGRWCWTFRVILHAFMIFVTIYMTMMLMVMYCLKRRMYYAG